MSDFDPFVPAPDAPPAQPAGGDVKRFFARALYWSPVWAPLVLLAQITLLGLGPALAESHRLGNAEEELDGRLARERKERAELERTLRAQSDPIYIERERRGLRDASSPLNADGAK